MSTRFRLSDVAHQASSSNASPTLAMRFAFCSRERTVRNRYCREVADLPLSGKRAGLLVARGGSLATPCSATARDSVSKRHFGSL